MLDLQVQKPIGDGVRTTAPGVPPNCGDGCHLDVRDEPALVLHVGDQKIQRSGNGLETRGLLT
jgi:hypothetical protein